MLKILGGISLITAGVVCTAATVAAADTAAATSEPAWRFSRIVHYSGTTTLDGVTAISDRDVWVIGLKAETGPAFALHWNGRTGKDTSLPDPLRTAGRLTVTTASATDNVWAFGTSGPNAYALRWEGRRWAVAHQWQREGSGTVKGAVALSPSDVWAFAGDGNPYDDMGTWHFDGTRWTRISTDFALTAGSALTPGDIWAIGTQPQPDGTADPMVARWDGGQWTQVPTPDIPHEWAYPPSFTAIHATSPSDVWVVGSKVERIDGDLRILPLALHWDGTAWQVVDVPGVGGLRSVTSDEQGGIWVAGEINCTLMRYTVGEWNCPQLPQVEGKRLGIKMISRTLESPSLWSVGELAWGGLPNTDGAILKYSQ